jgi:hypothetical protein
MPSESNLSGARREAPVPRRTRTNRDWVMISLGVLLICLFLVAGYLSLAPRGKETGGPLRGPVKNPNTSQSQNMPGETAPRQK